ncbi:MAG: hypothetical protein ACLUMK_00160 [Christensenellales bacterium]
MTFNANEGTVTPAEKTVYCDQDYEELPTPTREAIRLWAGSPNRMAARR